MSDDKQSTQRVLFGDPGLPGAGLSVAVVALLVLAALAVGIGVLCMPDAMVGPGLVGIGLFLAIAARICQARDQHQALYRLLGRRPPQ